MATQTVSSSNFDVMQYWGSATEPTAEPTEPVHASVAVPDATEPTKAAEPVVMPANAKQKQITEPTLFLKVRFSSLGNTRKVAGDVLDTDADKTFLSVSKQLLDSDELKKIQRRDMQVRKWLENQCLPYDIGLSILPLALVEKVHAKLEAYLTERAGLVDAFIAAYPGLCANAAENLRSLYSASNYPPVDVVRSRFGFSWDYVTFSTPGDLKDISPALFASQNAKFAKQLENAAQEITSVMRQSLAELVSHLAERLTPSEDGKTKRLHETAITNLTDFLDTFKARNITNDTELAELVQKARSLVSGVSVEGLRKSDKWRSDILSGMHGIQDKLSGMVQTQGTRYIREDE